MALKNELLIPAWEIEKCGRSRNYTHWRHALKQNREKYADQIEIDVLHIIVLGWNSHEKAFHLVTIIAVFAIEIVIFERN